MKMRARFVVPALLAAAAVPSIVLAQSQTQPPDQNSGKAERQAQRPRLSPEARERLMDGRFAMIKETLKLDEAQLKLWQPVEAQMRSAAAERRKRFEERRQAREQGAVRPSLPERLDRASERMSKRAEQMKAFADVFKPFYASLNDEQKAMAGIVLRQARGGMRWHRPHRWAMQH